MLNNYKPIKPVIRVSRIWKLVIAAKIITGTSILKKILVLFYKKLSKIQFQQQNFKIYPVTAL